MPEVDGFLAIPANRVAMLLEMVEKQLDFETACYCAGIPWNHMVWVARQAARHPSGAAEQLMVDIMTSKAIGKASLVTAMYESDNPRWKAWLLEKKYPEEYGKRIEVSGTREDNLRTMTQRLKHLDERTPEALMEGALAERERATDAPQLTEGDSA